MEVLKNSYLEDNQHSSLAFMSQRNEGVNEDVCGSVRRVGMGVGVRMWVGVCLDVMGEDVGEWI